MPGVYTEVSIPPHEAEAVLDSAVQVTIVDSSSASEPTNELAVKVGVELSARMYNTSTVPPLVVKKK
jgi:hypothetical protein